MLFFAFGALQNSPSQGLKQAPKFILGDKIPFFSDMLNKSTLVSGSMLCKQ